MPTLFKSLAELCEALETTSKRLLKINLASSFLSSLDPQEIEPAVSMLLGRPFPRWDQRTLDVSWTTLSQIIKRLTKVDSQVFSEAFNRTGDIGTAIKIVFEKIKVGKQTSLLEKSLTINEVRRSFEVIAETEGVGSREKKERLIEMLLSQASPVEIKCLMKIFIGEMRTGFQEGLMEQAVSKTFEIPLRIVQNASMIIGDIGIAASTARSEGERGLSEVSFMVFRPVTLMLAQTTDDVSSALKEHGGKTSFEYKYDGARIQIHKSGSEVRIYSRRLTDVTRSLPEVVKAASKNISAREAILEGEVIAVDAQGHPVPFQHLMRRFRRVRGIADAAERIPVKLYLFDILYLNGQNLISTPYIKRRHILAENAGEIPLTTQMLVYEPKKGESFLRQAIGSGHEGLMAKRLDGQYQPGIRGKRWLKIKPVLEPLDLVIIAAEYGYGRRHRWLSDYYLAARDSKTGEFQTVGKTFKGLTDAEMIDMTRRLKELAIETESRRVVVAPKIVVEVAYNEIQRSPKYASQMALRFARIKRIRDDKTPEEADTIAQVREIYESQFKKKGRYRTEQQQ